MTTKSLEDWAQEKNVPDYAIAGAKVFNKWGQGHQLSEADFDKGIDAYQNIPLGGPDEPQGTPEIPPPNAPPPGDSTAELPTPVEPPKEG